ncbi:unnamed protein product [Hermetia illucens]|uniref:Uncharacterized protein n=1 Tax=Hermetia illucens TaxID=343691 RepID=A0A7R8UCI3_HERIL|nr:unnamed protein product [Hermetia illucens]
MDLKKTKTHWKRSSSRTKKRKFQGDTFSDKVNADYTSKLEKLRRTNDPIALQHAIQRSDDRIQATNRRSFFASQQAGGMPDLTKMSWVKVSCMVLESQNKLRAQLLSQHGIRYFIDSNFLSQNVVRSFIKTIIYEDAAMEERMPYDLHCPCIPSDPNYRFSSNRREEMPIFTTGQDAESPLLPHGSAGSPTVSQNRSRDSGSKFQSNKETECYVVSKPGTFSHLTALEEIDLANNALLTIPSELFQLPSLRNLYVDSNDLYDLDETLETLEKPIRAPLEYLNVANCGLQKIPRLGILPYILHLNASMNPLQAAVAQDFVPMCHIKSLDLRKTTMDPCNCLAIVEYLESLKVIVTDRIDCDIVDRKACDPVAFAIDTKDYDDCKSVTLNKESQNSWIIIFACIGASLVLLICGLCWYQKRRSNARRAQRRVNQEGPNRELLRNAN